MQLGKKHPNSLRFFGGARRPHPQAVASGRKVEQFKGLQLHSSAPFTMPTAAEKFQQRKKERAEAEEKLKASFAVFDTNGSGCLCAAEVLQILTRALPDAPGMSESDAKDFIHDFDANGDDKLDINEFTKAMCAITGQDANEDGDICEDEIDSGVADAAKAIGIAAAAHDGATAK